MPLENERDVERFSKEWTLGPSFWGVGNVRADGVGILFFSWEVMLKHRGYCSREGDFCVDAKWRGWPYGYKCVLPSKRDEREGFLGKIFSVIVYQPAGGLGRGLNMSLEKSSGGNWQG